VETLEQGIKDTWHDATAAAPGTFSEGDAAVR
jgi:hypothetical protein